LNLCRDPARARAAAAPRTIHATAAAGTPARRSSNPKAKSRMTDTSRANKDLVLITGASGFVGSAVARIALEKGFAVRLLVRATSPRKNLESLDVEIVTGDMRDEASMRKALDGVRYLFHVAADYRLWAPDPLEIERANLEGAEATMRAALAAGVERIVYTSSVATLKVTSSGNSADETSPLKADQAIGVYKRSKVIAERAVERMIEQDGLPAVIVNPSTPIGPRDVKPTPTGRIIVEAATGKMPAFVDTGLNLVHVDDVANGHFLALERGRIGERYILGGENLPLQQMLADIAGMVGRKPPTIALPRWPLYPLAMGAEAVARITKREPFVTVDALKMSKNKMYFTSAKAERELGYQARPYREGLKDALAWFREAGYLNAK
jgi:dihydroflavonol-4-reductase